MLSRQWKVYFLVSFVNLLLAILMASWGFPKIVNYKIKKNLEIAEGSPMLEKFKKVPVAIQYFVYLFNVTNPDDVTNGAKPILQEVGPYIYDEYREKTIIRYGENDTIDYMLQKKFYFNENSTRAYMWNSDPDEELTVIHFPYLAAILTVHEMVPTLVGMVNGALQELFSNITDPFLRVKPKDLLFDGVFLNCTGEHPALGLVCGRIRSEAPPNMRPAEDGSGFYFSLFNHVNTTPTGPYTVKRGSDNIYNMGTIVAYKNSTKVTKWSDPFCNMINGTDGAVNPPIPGSDPPQRLYSFQPDLCRSVYVTYEKTSTFGYLQPMYRYVNDKSVLASKSAVPENKCFCKKNWSSKHDGCLVMGVMSLSTCQSAPVVISWPHFYLASEELLEYIGGGLNPNKSIHGSRMDIHPLTGVIAEGSQKIQFNIELRNIKGVPQLENVRTGLFPLLWVDENARIPDEIADQLLSSQSQVKYVDVARWGYLVASLILFCVCAYVLAAQSFRFLSRNSNSVTFMMTPGAQNEKSR